MILIFIIITGLIGLLNGDSISAEEKYVETLPTKEKKEFLDSIAIRILDEINSTETEKKIGEVGDVQNGNIHSDFVAKVIKKESLNIKRRSNEEISTLNEPENINNQDEGGNVVGGDDRSEKIPDAIDLTLVRRSREKENGSSSIVTEVAGNSLSALILTRNKRSPKKMKSEIKKIAHKIDKRTKKDIKKIVKKIFGSKTMYGKSRRVRSVDDDSRTLNFTASSNSNGTISNTEINDYGSPDLNQEKPNFSIEVSIEDENNTRNHDRLPALTSTSTTIVEFDGKTIPVKVVYDDKLQEKQLLLETVNSSTEPSIHGNVAVTEISIKNGDIILLKESKAKIKANAAYTRWPKEMGLRSITPDMIQDVNKRNASNVSGKTDNGQLLINVSQNSTKAESIASQNLKETSLSVGKNKTIHLEDKLKSEIKDIMTGKFKSELNKIHNKADKIKYIEDALNNTLSKFNKQLHYKISKVKSKKLTDQKHDIKNNESKASDTNNTAASYQLTSPNETAQKGSNKIVASRRIDMVVNYESNTNAPNSNKAVIEPEASTKAVEHFDSQNLDKSKSMLDNEGGETVSNQQQKIIQSEETILDNAMANISESQGELTTPNPADAIEEESHSEKNGPIFNERNPFTLKIDNLTSPNEAANQENRVKSDVSNITDDNTEKLNHYKIEETNLNSSSSTQTLLRVTRNSNSSDTATTEKLVVSNSNKPDPEINIENTENLGKSKTIEEATTKTSETTLNDDPRSSIDDKSKSKQLNTEKPFEEGNSTDLGKNPNDGVVPMNDNLNATFKETDPNKPVAQKNAEDVTKNGMNSSNQTADTAKEPILFSIPLSGNHSSFTTLSDSSAVTTKAPKTSNSGATSSSFEKKVKFNETEVPFQAILKSDDDFVSFFNSHMKSLETLNVEPPKVKFNETEEPFQAILKSDDDFVSFFNSYLKSLEPHMKQPLKNEKAYKVFEVPPGHSPFDEILHKKNEAVKYENIIGQYKQRSDSWKQGPPSFYSPVYNYAPDKAYYNPKNRLGPNDNSKEKLDKTIGIFGADNLLRENGNLDLSDLASKNEEQPHFAPVYNYGPENAYFNPENRYGPNNSDEQKESDQEVNLREGREPNSNDDIQYLKFKNVWNQGQRPSNSQSFKNENGIELKSAPFEDTESLSYKNQNKINAIESIDNNFEKNVIKTYRDIIDESEGLFNKIAEILEMKRLQDTKKITDRGARTKVTNKRHGSKAAQKESYLKDIDSEILSKIFGSTRWKSKATSHQGSGRPNSREEYYQILIPKNVFKPYENDRYSTVVSGPLKLKHVDKQSNHRGTSHKSTNWEERRRHSMADIISDYKMNYYKKDLNKVMSVDPNTMKNRISNKLRHKGYINRNSNEILEMLKLATTQKKNKTKTEYKLNNNISVADLDLIFKMSNEIDLLPTLKALEVLRTDPKIKEMIHTLKKIKKVKEELLKDNPDPKKLTNMINDLRTFVRTRHEDEIDSQESKDEYLAVVVKELRKMINNDNEALAQYNWLATAVNTQSALSKLLLLIEDLREGNRIHSSDLQLLKYMLYLLRSSKLELGSKMTLVLPQLKYIKKKKYLLKKKENHLTRDTLLEKRITEGGLQELERFLSDLQMALDDLHDALKHISLITTYDNQDWYENLKDLYLNKPSRKKILEVVLHLTAMRFTDLIEDSTRNGLKENFLNYVKKNPEDVSRTQEELVFILKLLKELDILR